MVSEKLKEVETLKRDLMQYIDDNPIIDTDGRRKQDIERKIAYISSMNEKLFNVRSFSFTA